MNKIMTLLLVALLSGCAGFTGVKKQGNYAYYGEIKGEYTLLAQCVADTMAEDKRWKISRLKYEIKDYPNKKRLMVNARAWTLLGQYYVFSLELNQTTQDITTALLKGNKFESEEVLKVLKLCAVNN